MTDTSDRQRWALTIANDVLDRVKLRSMRHALILHRDGSTEIRRWHERQSDFGDSLVGVYDTRATLIDVAEDLLAAWLMLPMGARKATAH